MPLMTDWLSPCPVSSGAELSGSSQKPGPGQVLEGPGRRDRGIIELEGYMLLAIALTIESNRSIKEFVCVP